jgi:hypothetical protein
MYNCRGKERLGIKTSRYNKYAVDFFHKWILYLNQKQNYGIFKLN